MKLVNVKDQTNWLRLFSGERNDPPASSVLPYNRKLKLDNAVSIIIRKGFLEFDYCNKRLKLVFSNL